MVLVRIGTTCLKAGYEAYYLLNYSEFGTVGGNE
jgi:hypothetical protein